MMHALEWGRVLYCSFPKKKQQREQHVVGRNLRPLFCLRLRRRVFRLAHRLGMTYDEESGEWRRGARPLPEAEKQQRAHNVLRMQTAAAEKDSDELKQLATTAMAAASAGATGPAPRVAMKERFKRRESIKTNLPAAAPDALDDDRVELLTRLGYKFDATRLNWSRGAPTRSPLPTVITAGARTLEVRASDEVDARAAGRLQVGRALFFPRRSSGVGGSRDRR